MCLKNILVIILIIFIAKSSLALDEKVVVNRDLYFGLINYYDSPSFYRISGNNLQSNDNTSATYNSMAKSAIITIYGQPNDKVSLSFVPNKLSGDSGFVTVENVEVDGGNNTIQLDANGLATVNISATLKISNKDLKGNFTGDLKIIASYKSNSITLYNNIKASVNLYNLKDSTVSQMNFGSIYVPKTSACTVVLNVSGTRTTTCPNVEGSYSLNVFIVNSSIFPTIQLPSSAQLANSTGQTLTINNFKSKYSGSIGAYTFTIGATLNVPINAALGIYTGTYNVTIIL